MMPPMSDTRHPDHEVLSKIGLDALLAAGFEWRQIKQWNYRGVAWPKRGVVAALAKAKRVPLPADFVTCRAEPPKAAKSKPRKRSAA